MKWTLCLPDDSGLLGMVWAVYLPNGCRLLGMVWVMLLPNGCRPARNGVGYVPAK